MHAGAPARTRPVRNTLQHCFNLTDLAVAVDLKDLVDCPSPWCRIPDRYRTTVFERVGSKRSVVIEVDRRVDQTALLIHGEHSTIANPGVLAVVPQAEGLLAAVVERTWRRFA